MSEAEWRSTRPTPPRRMRRDSSALDLHNRLARTSEAGVDMLLDVGCGRGAHLRGTLGERVMRSLKAGGTTMVGIDIDLPDEPHLILDDVRLVGTSGAFPIADETVDVLFSDWVLEHINDPQVFFGECARVLRPGGVMLARTLQRWGVASVGARVVPDRLHDRLIGLLQPGMNDQDVFPVRLACNTRAAMRKYCARSGLVITEIKSHGGLAGYVADQRFAELVVASVEGALPKSMKHSMVITAIKAL